MSIVQSNYQTRLSRVIESKHGTLKSEFISALKPIMVICEKQHEFSLLPTEIIKGSWCPICTQKPINAEFEILLSDLGLSFEKNFKPFPDTNLVFDYKINEVDTNILIDIDDADLLVKDTTLQTSIRTKISRVQNSQYRLIRIETTSINDGFVDQLAESLTQTEKIIMIDSIHYEHILKENLSLPIPVSEPKIVSAVVPVEMEKSHSARQTPTVKEKRVYNNNVDEITDWPKGSVTAVGYVRVSTEEQVSGFSLEAQEQMIRDYAAKNKLIIRRIFADEGISGSIPAEKRDGLAKLLTSLRSGEVIIMYSLSRLGRDTFQNMSFERSITEKHCTLKFTDNSSLDTTSNEGKLLFPILSAVVEAERNAIRKRTQDVMGHLARTGKLVTKPSYGYKIENGKLVPHEEEQKVVKKIIELYQADGGRSINAVCKELTKLGIQGRTTSKGKITTTWCWKTVQHILETSGVLDK